MAINTNLTAAIIGGMVLFSPLAAQAEPNSQMKANAPAYHDGVQLASHDFKGGRVRLYVEPERARIGSRVGISARGLRPGVRITLMGGRNPGHLRRIGTVRVDERGRLYTRVQVPEWASPGRNFFFALQSSHGRIIAQSRPIRVMGGMEDDERVSVTGELLRANATCPRLAGDNGRIYTLTGDLEDFRPGDRVRVSGEVAEVSICQQGTTITVNRIRDAE